jgi:hypothetical protein
VLASPTACRSTDVKQTTIRSGSSDQRNRGSDRTTLSPDVPRGAISLQWRETANCDPEVINGAGGIAGRGTLRRRATVVASTSHRQRDHRAADGKCTPSRQR